MALFLICGMFVCSGSVSADLNAEQKTSLAKIRSQLKVAGKLFKQREFKSAGETVEAVQESLAALSSEVSAIDRRRLKTVHRSLERAHALLELEGVSLPPLPALKAAEPNPSGTAGNPTGFQRRSPQF